MLVGKRSWKFQNTPAITATGVTGGPFEAKSPLKDDFDLLYDDLRMGEKSYEKAHRLLLEEATQIALEKAGIQKEDVHMMIAGDLINQITPTSFAARNLEIPYLGIFGACSTSMEGLALASFFVNYGGAGSIITGASSHNAAVERQFRYPTEYGGQKPPTAQWTVTGAGVGLIQPRDTVQGDAVVTTSATIGKVKDYGLKDPFNMGGAMAPAASDTIVGHFQDLGINPSAYDAIITGDLGKIGRETLLDLLQKEGYAVPEEQLQDCGLKIYDETMPVQSGASGAGCSATVLYGHLMNKLRSGELRKILLVATGALLSPISFQQKESIPCIAHAVSIELDDGKGGSGL
ncbi:stage V sporulation protein AD [Bacillus fonticola]|uniref:stage V sporulation protein AD n=1 Tax=Bacillus fonticola TaxID=2728853 RepID=UPI001472E7F0|nr:stage V sporulation protein AD [Bacillus fonticola]